MESDEQSKMDVEPKDEEQTTESTDKPFPQVSDQHRDSAASVDSGYLSSAFSQSRLNLSFLKRQDSKRQFTDSQDDPNYDPDSQPFSPKKRPRSPDTPSKSDEASFKYPPVPTKEEQDLSSLLTESLPVASEDATKSEIPQQQGQEELVQKDESLPEMQQAQTDEGTAGPSLTRKRSKKRRPSYFSSDYKNWEKNELAGPQSTPYKHFLRFERESVQLYGFYERLKKPELCLYTTADMIKRTHTSAEILYKKGDSYPIMTLSAHQVPTKKEVRKILGFRIKYVGECPLLEKGDCCELVCPHCKVCSHMYRCSCPTRKYKHRGWCVHMHAAVQCGRNAFKQDRVVFFHTTKRKMRLAHARALCYADKDITRLEDGGYRICAPGDMGNGTGPMYHIHVLQEGSSKDTCKKCPSYKHCAMCIICRHNIRCTCDAYVNDKLVCEHCHAVSIHVCDNFVALYRNPTMFYENSDENTNEDSSDSSSDNDEKDQVQARRLNRIVSAHHERALLIPKHKIATVSVPDSSEEDTDDEDVVPAYQLKLSHIHELFEGVDPHEEPKRMTTFAVDNSKSDKTWTVTKVLDSCYEHPGVECRSICLDCRICEYQFKCDCGKPANQICKHIHFVCQMRKSFWFEKSDCEEDANFE